MCSTDGRIRVFLDEMFDNKTNEEDEIDDYEGVEEVSVRSSDEERSQAGDLASNKVIEEMKEEDEEDEEDREY